MAIQLAGLDPEIRPYAEAALQSAARFGLTVTITSVRRTWASQQQLRDRYEGCLAKYGRVGTDLPAGCQYPANAPGDSAHNYGLAWDSVVDDADWPLWNYIRSWHGWGLDAGDRVHAEVKNWRSFVDRWTAPPG